MKSMACQPSGAAISKNAGSAAAARRSVISRSRRRG
jgi:hypothetical protein